MLERILVPLDGSPTSRQILPQLRTLLRAKDTEALFFRAVGNLPAPVGAHPLSIAVGMKEIEEDALRDVEAVAEEWAEQGARTRALVGVGEPADAILDAVKDHQATLIAISTHGRSGIARWTMGSVAEKVLRASPVPLLVVRSLHAAPGGRRPAAEEEHPFRRILVPTDLSGLSLRVVPGVVELARIFGSSIDVLHVEELLPHGEIPTDPGRRTMERVLEAFATEGVSARPIFRKGDVATQILEAAKGLPADLLAMTTHGRSGFSRWVLGSVAEKVIRSADIPVLAVRRTHPAGSNATGERKNRRCKKAPLA